MLSALVPESAQRRIRQFVDEVFLPRAVLLRPGAPVDMVDGPPDASGWVPWKPVPSPVTDADILAVEHVAGAPFPPLFRGWLMYKCLLMTDCGLVRLPETSSDDPLHQIREYVGIMDSQPYFRPRRVLPFGSDGNDVGPLCFDLSRPRPDGDYPVILFDHKLLHRPEYAERPFADSFGALLDMLEADMRSFD
ncbi:MAG: SMI1/KNR4 family protein [Verrucomicrobiota bacterium]